MKSIKTISKILKNVFLVVAIFFLFINAVPKINSLKKGDSESAKGNCCSNPNSKSQMTSLPFYYSNRIIKLKAKINNDNKDFEFVLDSGAPTFITDSVLNEYSPELINTMDAYDANHNQLQINNYRINSFSIYGKKFKNIEAANSSFVHNMAVLKGKANGGLIGANIMKHYIWMINYKCNEITITDNIELLKIPENAFITKMSKDANGSPIISINIGERKKHTFVIDLAYNGSVLLPAKFLKKPLFNDSLAYTKKEILSTGFNSKISLNSYQFIKKMEIGKFELKNVKCSTSGKNSRSLIGNEFLENYIIVLDFINNQFIIIPTINEKIGKVSDLLNS